MTPDISLKLSKRDVAADSVMTLVNKSDTDEYVLEITNWYKRTGQVDTKFDTIFNSHFFLNCENDNIIWQWFFIFLPISNTQCTLLYYSCSRKVIYLLIWSFGLLTKFPKKVVLDSSTLGAVYRLYIKKVLKQREEFTAKY